MGLLGVGTTLPLPQETAGRKDLHCGPNFTTGNGGLGNGSVWLLTYASDAQGGGSGGTATIPRVLVRNQRRSPTCHLGMHHSTRDQPLNSDHPKPQILNPNTLEP
jgi:hypothetical protein